MSPVKYACSAQALGEGIVLLELSGELDHAAAPLLSQKITEQHLLGNVRLILDLSRLDYIDSSGRGVLVRGLRQTQEDGGGIVLVAPQGRVRGRLIRSGLAQLLPIKETLDGARAHWKSSDRDP